MGVVRMSLFLRADGSDHARTGCRRLTSSADEFISEFFRVRDTRQVLLVPESRKSTTETAGCSSDNDIERLRIARAGTRHACVSILLNETQGLPRNMMPSQMRTVAILTP